MLSDLQATIQAVFDLFKLEFKIYGFTLSWWQVFLWAVIAGLLLKFVSEVFHDD